jgi:hypothetical protein
VFEVVVEVVVDDVVEVVEVDVVVVGLTSFASMHLSEIVKLPVPIALQ